MRKAIAMITIILLVLVLGISCEAASSQNGLCQLSLSIGSSRAIEISGANLEGLTYEYALIPEFEAITNEVYGQVGTRTNGTVSGFETLTVSGGSANLGYMTQGKWTIYVNGKKNDTVVTKGESSFYLNSSNQRVSVNMVRAEGEGTVSYSLSLNQLSENHTSEYSIKFQMKDAETAANIGSEITASAKLADGSYTGSYEGSFTFAAGSYQILVTLYRGETAIGTIRKTIEVVNAQTTEVKGEVLPSSFVEATLEVNTVKANCTVAAAASGKTVTYTATVNGSTPADYTASYSWTVNGNAVEGSSNVLSVNYTTYGDKEVTCTVTYSKAGSNVTAPIYGTSRVRLTPAGVAEI